MDNQMPKSPFVNIAIAVALLLTALVGFMTVRDVVAAQTTGVIDVTSSKPGAIITISGSETQAAIAGYGSIKIRVPEGDYLVSATVPGSQTATNVHVTNQQTTEASLDLSKTNALPTVNDIDFQNFEELITNGLSTGRLNSVQLAIFDYDNHAKTAKLQSNTIYTAPLNPNSNDSTFGLTFNLDIDNKSFKATLRYSFGTKITLILNDKTTNKQVFKETVDAATLYEQPSPTPPKGYNSADVTEAL